MANYSKWPQEPKEEDFKFSTAFSAKRPLVASTNVSGVEDQGSRLVFRLLRRPPLQGLPPLHGAAAVTREPQPWSTRREGRLPYPIGGVAAHAAASGRLAPARALGTRPRLRPGDLEAEPGPRGS
ncbi:hypothetical protein NN561_015082 [Cricetulus griseus]